MCSFLLEKEPMSILYHNLEGPGTVQYTQGPISCPILKSGIVYSIYVLSISYLKCLGPTNISDLRFFILCFVDIMRYTGAGTKSKYKIFKGLG